MSTEPTQPLTAPAVASPSESVDSILPSLLTGIGWLCLAAGAVVLVDLNHGYQTGALMWQVGAVSIAGWIFWLSLGLALQLLVDIRNAAVHIRSSPVAPFPQVQPATAPADR